MIRGLLAKKLGMSQIFDKDGNLIPVTVLLAGPCAVLGIIEKPTKVKLGFEPIKESKLRKPEIGFFKKIGIAPLRFIREVESTDNKEVKIGQEIKVDMFKPGDFVDVTGISRGMGFQGGMKRWNWSGGPATHGSLHHRRVGSIGSNTFPGRTFRGRHMPGHMGDERVTVQGLRVIQIDVEKNLLLLKGAVPGCKNSYITVNRSKKRAYQALDEKRVTEEKKRNPMKQSKAKAKGK
jgi:large subunit ribosomal protein L3